MLPDHSAEPLIERKLLNAKHIGTLHWNEILLVRSSFTFCNFSCVHSFPPSLYNKQAKVNCKYLQKMFAGFTWKYTIRNILGRYFALVIVLLINVIFHFQCQTIWLYTACNRLILAKGEQGLKALCFVFISLIYVTRSSENKLFFSREK